MPLLQRAAAQASESGLSCRKAAIINVSTLISSIEKCYESFRMAPMYPYRTSKVLRLLHYRTEQGGWEKGMGEGDGGGVGRVVLKQVTALCFLHVDGPQCCLSSCPPGGAEHADSLPGRGPEEGRHPGDGYPPRLGPDGHGRVRG